MMNPTFVWFEFDNEVALLWQSLTAPAPQGTFAYQAKLRQLIEQSPNWGVNLESLKLIDVFLSAVKSDLAGRNVKEHELVSHPEFVKLLMVLGYHVAKVLGVSLSGGIDEMAYHANGVFGRIYARTFGGSQASGLSQDELTAFYQGLAYLAKATNAHGKVAQGFFVLSVIGARLFGSPHRIFKDLDAHGTPSVAVEDSLYWAVSDFIQKMPTLNNDKMAQLLEPPAMPKVAPPAEPVAVADVPDVAVSLTKEAQPQSDTITPVAPTKPEPAPSTPAMSARKQKARASHTPKLFQEIHDDLKNLPMPSDNDPAYQKAKAVLDKIDGHINEQMAKGKAMADISFNDKTTQVRTQAIQLLSTAVKQGNLSAMTRLAVYLFEGRGVPANIATATKLIKKSAELGDIRAQKLLSRLYYQGFAPDEGGFGMSVEMGEMWLNKSADGGHPEAKKVRAYMNQVEMLKDTHRTEIESDKRYLLWGSILVGGILLILVLMTVLL